MKANLKTMILFTLVLSINVGYSIGAIAQEETAQEETAQEKTVQENNQQPKQNQAKAKPKKIEEAVLGMNVTGNKELPNVLHIVPWKSDATPLQAPMVSRLVNEIYAPVEPEVFTKQVNFYYQLTLKNKQSTDPK